jgi:hypothetical protein
MQPARLHRCSDNTTNGQHQRPAPTAMMHTEVLADKLEENVEELVELLLKAARAGEWRVVGIMWDQEALWLQVRPLRHSIFAGPTKS